MNKSKGFREVIERFKQLIESTEQLPEIKRGSQITRVPFRQELERIILDGLVGFYGFYSSPLGNLLKAKDFLMANPFAVEL
jgi:hypothetical protein